MQTHPPLKAAHMPNSMMQEAHPAVTTAALDAEYMVRHCCGLGPRQNRALDARVTVAALNAFTMLTVRAPLACNTRPCRFPSRLMSNLGHR